MINVKSAQELGYNTDSPYAWAYGTLKGCIEFLLNYKDGCKTYEELNGLIDKVFKSVIE